MAGDATRLSPSWLEQSKVGGYRIEKLSSLSAPKGKRYVCELTGGSANVALVTPFVTLYYGSKSDAVLSWEGIMHKLAPLLGPLRTKPILIGSEEERLKREYTMRMSKRALIDLTRDVAQKFLVQSRYDLAIPGALQSLSFSIEIFGKDHIEVVPAYLLLAEAFLGKKQFAQAKQYLSLANWGVLKHPCSNRIRSQLHRNFGKLFLARGKFQEALEHTAKDVYNMSLEVGPDHVDVTGGYYLLALIFVEMNKVESALAMFDKVVDVWYTYLGAVRVQGEDAVKELHESQLSKAMEMMRVTSTHRSGFLGADHIATAESLYTLGLLEILFGDSDSARKNITTASKVYKAQLGTDHPSSQDIEMVLKQMNEHPSTAA